MRLQHGLLACALLFGAYGCAVLAGAGTPFPDKVPASEAPAKSSIPMVAPPPQIPPFQASSPLSHEPQPQSLPLLKPLVVTQLDEVAPLPGLDEQILTLLLSEPLPVTDLLRLLLRETAVSVVPDSGINEMFSGELKDVTLRQALDLVLRPLDLDYRMEDGVLRVVRRPLQTRVFEVNFVTTSRIAIRRVSTGSAEGAANRTAVVSRDDRDLFTELEKAVRPLLSISGRAHLDRGAGLLQVTDLPERVDAVGDYLDRFVRRAGRQVYIEAHIIEVALFDTSSAGLDWRALNRMAPALRNIDSDSIRPVLRTRADVDRFLEALEQQGDVTTISRPTAVTMNNEPVVIRIDTRYLPVETPGLATPRPVTASIVLSMTPQVGLDGLVTLSVTPSVTTVVGLRRFGPGDPVPTLMVRETDTLLRVRDGETAVLAGWLHRAEPPAPVGPNTDTGSGTARAPAARLTNLVILLTPTVFTDH